MTRWLVVGGGTAGCVAAARLAEDATNHVTLLEAGSADASPSPAVSYLDDLAAPQLLWSALQAHDGDERTRPYPQGRGLGGSGLVNGTVLSGADLPQYAQWGWTGLAATRDRIRIPFERTPTDQLGPVDLALLGSAGDAEPALLSRRRGRRVTTADEYVRATVRTNLELRDNTHVARVTTANGRATGVVTLAGERVRADRVVCAAGAIHTPALLLRSGITTPGIGESLTDHPSRTVDLVLRSDASSDPHGLVTGAVLRRGGIELVALNHLGAQRPGHAALLVGLLHTSRRGTVRLDPERPDDPTAAPVVDFGRLDDPGDRCRLDAGVALAERLLASPAFDDIVERCVVRGGFGGYAHATSTCRTGTVVDDAGAVGGYEGLFVCDASVFPDIPAAGTYLPTVLLAERLAGRWRRFG